ncbi:hypothetical protein K437DRAFT_257096 [Tilletiaria anomala UBC 951]|uniref:DUF7137 domain-containing protein n=1 Tax=Tilletiaria anomala (strain ATCC 24038 / CBS 436.72 / UBC 951) TaxID=1037660 RepID=A0A066VRR1_TILAU|nr:uncharacterized protein K437DRAFT_257096 [Tilletiaria anomala UBC 951]KDN44392.1 hypothetical protein K437DRAFT_257096 [Tilletiaria anomala UBC 951]
MVAGSVRRLWIITLFSILVISSISAYAQAADPNAGPVTGNAVAQAQQSGSSASATSTIPDSAPIGGVTVTQPAETADASYYKIAPGVKVTFGWNFTYVLQTPKTLFINAICTKNSNTYSLAGPTGLPGTATNFTWDPYAYYQSAPASGLPALIQATYRLVISDPEVTANAAGKMATNSKVQFALYIPQPYTPLASYICGDCSGAAGLRSVPPAMLALIATFTVMLAGGYGVLVRGLGAGQL